MGKNLFTRRSQGERKLEVNTKPHTRLEILDEPEFWYFVVDIYTSSMCRVPHAKSNKYLIACSRFDFAFQHSTGEEANSPIVYPYQRCRWCVLKLRRFDLLTTAVIRSNSMNHLARRSNPANNDILYRFRLVPPAHTALTRYEHNHVGTIKCTGPPDERTSNTAMQDLTTTALLCLYVVFTAWNSRLWPSWRSG